ncbi:MAG TPA: hypothetical protein VG148_16495 [Pyrinomonadaceae bacterium]|nr:hypothetical protein [Pyrinomonadaceae bacterium]
MSAAPAHAPAAARAEFGDALVLLYALVFARQYFWVVENNAVAWALAAAAALAATYIYVKTKPLAPEPPGRSFWLVVALPLLFVYALRAPFPDFSFDVLNYRLLHAERSLRGPLFAAGDFFPTPAPYNPAPDTLTGLFRYLLGYRLGTVVNLLALVWAAQLTDRILRPSVARAWLRALCVLAVVLAEHLLFEVNTYMADLLALPLLLEATLLALRAGGAGRPRAVFVRAALLLGAAVAFKLTNLVAAVPVALVCAHQALFGPGRMAARELIKTTALALAAFAAPLLPFAVYLCAQTGNPFFPLANTLFRSPYWPTGGGWDGRWGPRGAWETLLWPVLVFFEPGRHSELAVYSGRLGLGFAASLAGLFVARRGSTAWTLCLISLLGCLLWSAAGMGYSRYGLHLELLSGAAVVAVASTLLARGPAGRRSPLAPAAGVLFAALLAAQVLLACRLAGRYEWAMRRTALDDFDGWAADAKEFLRDRSLVSYLPAAERERLAGVGVWVESGMKSNGVEALLSPETPVLGVRYQEYFTTGRAWRRYAEAVERAAGGRALSLCLPEDLPSALAAVRGRGLGVERFTPVEVPFFSERRRVGMMLLEVSLPGEAEGLRRLAEGGSWKGGAFRDEDYRARVESLDAPAAMRAGEKRALRFRVENRGGATWPARGNEINWYQVNLGDRWLDPAGGLVNDMDARAALPFDLAPGASVELTLGVTAPRRPGDYVLEIDLVHEGITFFRDKGSRPLRLPVRVEP